MCVCWGGRVDAGCEKKKAHADAEKKKKKKLSVCEKARGEVEQEVRG